MSESRVYPCETYSEYQAIERDIQAAIDMSPVNKTIAKTTITAVGLENPDMEPFFIVGREEIRTGFGQCPVRFSQQYSLEDLPLMMRDIPAITATALTPIDMRYRSELEMRPTTDIMYLDEVVILDPMATAIFSDPAFREVAGHSGWVDRFEKNFHQAENHPVDALSRDIQSSIKSTRRAKKELAHQQQRVVRDIEERIGSLVNRPALMTAAQESRPHAVDPADRLAYLEAAAHLVSGEAAATDLHREVQQIQRQVNQLTTGIGQVETTARGIYHGSIDEEVMRLPGELDEDTLVKDFGLGSWDHLLCNPPPIVAGEADLEAEW